METYHYITLLRREELIELFRFGHLRMPFAHVGCGGDIEELRADRKLARTLFDKSDDFDYCTDRYLVHICREADSKGKCTSLKCGSPFFIQEVRDVFALDDKAFRLGLMLDPPILLKAPIWADTYRDWDVDRSLLDYEQGITNVALVFDVDFKPLLRKRNFIAFSKSTTKRDVVHDVLSGIMPSGPHDPWYYLLRYERHQNYPKDLRGILLDTLHAYANYTHQKVVDADVSTSEAGRTIMGLPTDTKYKDFWKLYAENEGFKRLSAALTKANYNDFMQVGSLFLQLKEIFKDGLEDGPVYFGKWYLPEAVEVIEKGVHKNDLTKALYLLGFCVGRELTYKYVYAFKHLNILKNK